MTGRSTATKTALSAALVAAGILGVGLSSAIAGEITGNGKSLKNDDGTLNGKSACAFSGRQDTPGEEPFREGSLAQSWGQIPKMIRDILATMGLHPGEACNPTKGGGEP